MRESADGSIAIAALINPVVELTLSSVQDPETRVMSRASSCTQKMASALATMLSRARASTTRPPPDLPMALWQPCTARSRTLPRASSRLGDRWMARLLILVVGLAA
ncbi:MAG: hypothetical protein ACKO32_11170 [Planctomycetia bacterium]